MRSSKASLKIFLVVCAVLIVSLYFTGCSRETTEEKEGLKGEAESKTEVAEPSISPETPESTDEISIQGTGTGVRIEPEMPGRVDVLMARIRESKGKPTYRWYVNNELVEDAEGPTFPADTLKKGDSVMVRVVTKQGEFTSEPVTIVNSPPVIKRAYLLPVSPKKGDMLKVDVEAEDPDGDDINIRYEWSVNGMAVGSDSNTLQADINRGDNVAVRITPVDEEGSEGRTMERSVIIGNAPPVVEGGVKDLIVKNSVLSGRIVATDPDGDPLELRVIDAPEGLTLDNDGMINWTLPEAATGTHLITVSVSDGHGGESIFNFELSLKSREG